jgi:chromate transport protein ChrA
MKIAALPIVAEAAMTIGWTVDPGFWRAMGLLLLAIIALYAWPRTAALGAILLTGYLGGAVATHVRIGNPFFSHTPFAVYLGVALWVGLWLYSTTADDDQPPRSRRSELARLDDEQRALIAWASRAADADD